MKTYFTILLTLSIIIIHSCQISNDDSLHQNTFTKEERLLDLATIWSEAKFSFTYYSTIEESWDSLYKHFVPRVINAKNDYEHYLELMRFVAHLNDGHSGVFFPPKIRESLGYPPIEIRKIDGRPVIFRLLDQNKSLINKNIRPGLEIVEIDGKPVSESIEFWRKIMSASTEQAKDRLAYFRILTGPINSNVDLVLSDPSGIKRKVTLKRTAKYFGDTNLAPSNISVTEQPQNGIGYFQANLMRSPVNDDFKEYLKTSAPLRGLIIDLRYNGGGSDLVSFDLISYLIDKPLPGPNREVNTYRADLRATGREQIVIQTLSSPIKPSDDVRFLGWIVVLIGEQSHSATEGGFLSVIKSRPKTILVGEPTAGSTGQPMIFKLGTGGVGAVCSRRTFAPDYSTFVGKGIQPDIISRLSISDVFKQVDAVKNEGFEIIEKKLLGDREN